MVAWRYIVTGALVLGLAAGRLRAEEDAITPAPDPADSKRADDTPANVFSPKEWERVDHAVERALAWLASQQEADGSFPTLEMGQPGVTSLCTMAFMAHGHMPGDGPYGKQLEQAAAYILQSQKANGLLSRVGPDRPRISRDVDHFIGVTPAYNHAISSLALSELYGMSQSDRAERMQRCIAKSLTATLEMQNWAKASPEDQGGWRYIGRPKIGVDSDLSVTGWELMFLRSARNAGFNVPKESIVDAVGYIRRCYSEKSNTFLYMRGHEDLRSRGMAGAGILALGHAGFHHSLEAQRTGQWLSQYNFDVYNGTLGFQRDRYHYSLFNSCQGMYQLGSPYWETFFPRTVQTLLENQQSDGSWPADRHAHDGPFGNAYTTALVVLSLGAPNQLLPIFQR